MSVIALSKEHFEAVYAGLWSRKERLSYRFTEIRDMPSEVFILWLKQLNEKNQEEYNKRYDCEGVEVYKLRLKPITLSDPALLKLCQCIAYNIDEDKILNDCINALKEKIITDLEDYKKGAWSI